LEKAYLRAEATPATTAQLARGSLLVIAVKKVDRIRFNTFCPPFAVSHPATLCHLP
jgi:hypothetical protein